MSKLGQVVESVEKYNRFVLDQVKRARTDEKFGIGGPLERSESEHTDHACADRTRTAAACAP